jgi:hypothetical protein
MDSVHPRCPLDTLDHPLTPDETRGCCSITATMIKERVENRKMKRLLKQKQSRIVALEVELQELKNHIAASVGKEKEVRELESSDDADDPDMSEAVALSLVEEGKPSHEEILEIIRKNGGSASTSKKS